MSGGRTSQDSIPFDYIQENMILPRRSSHGASLDKNEMEMVHRHDMENGFAYETHSLPRRTCIHHHRKDDNNTLPRRDHHHHHEFHRYSPDSAEILNGQPLEGILKKDRRGSSSRDSSADSNRQRFKKETNFQENHIPLRRTSHTPITPDTHKTQQRRSSHQPSMESNFNVSDEMCSTCESETDSHGEKEILIDFKPIPSPVARKKRLQKTLSEGEILIERKKDFEDAALMTSASEEDLITPDENKNENYFYRNDPIKDEGIFTKQAYLTPKSDGGNNNGNRRDKDTFRKRSVSLEESAVEEGPIIRSCIKSASQSPCPEELSVQGNSAFPSTDSLANDITRDHSDGTWNESQATVLHAEARFVFFYLIYVYSD